MRRERCCVGAQVTDLCRNVCDSYGDAQPSTAAGGDRGDNTARVEELQARILATPFPLGRGCCGADSPSDCHQRGICWMEGTHPDSPGCPPVPAADRQTDEERPPWQRLVPAVNPADIGGQDPPDDFTAWAARPAVADAVMADPGAAITEGVTEVRLRALADEWSALCVGVPARGSYDNGLYVGLLKAARELRAALDGEGA